MKSHLPFRKFIVLTAVLFAAVWARAQQRVTVTDSSDRTPVIAATVFAQSGNILGITDNNGTLAGISASDYPLTVRCIGYEPATCAAGQPEIALTPATYALGEVTVTPDDRPVMRMICYIREYSSGATPTDTIQYFAEHTADLFIPIPKKVKGLKSKIVFRPLASRHYDRTANSRGVDSVSCRATPRDDISWFQLVGMPVNDLDETEAIRSGARTDSVMGKHSRRSLMRRTPQAYTVLNDYLSDKKDHRESPLFFKLLGFTLDLTELSTNTAYRPNDSGHYGPADILSSTMALDILGRGKWIKKAFDSDAPVAMHGYFEIYPMSTEYLTVDEANELWRNAPTDVTVTPAPQATPLPEATAALVARAEKL